MHAGQSYEQKELPPMSVVWWGRRLQCDTINVHICPAICCNFNHSDVTLHLKGRAAAHNSKLCHCKSTCLRPGQKDRQYSAREQMSQETLSLLLRLFAWNVLKHKCFITGPTNKHSSFQNRRKLVPPPEAGASMQMKDTFTACNRCCNTFYHSPEASGFVMHFSSLVHCPMSHCYPERTENMSP